MNLLKTPQPDPTSSQELVAAGHLDRELCCWVDAHGVPVLTTLEWNFQ